ncbi:MAG: biotin--[acetyl-CoA-carboxylase] ligase [Nanoarchaeota archaeon]|nr:biotin--[acetyl-CoA-carboxylase] ligase [Nanoarchaeota archaeon]
MSKMFEIHKFECVGSTNSLARDYSSGNAIVAREQNKGRGRFDRKWVSSKGGLWFSIVLKPNRRLFEYTFIASLAVLESIKVNAKIKWPNDIVFYGKKLCGILSESVFEGNDARKVIIGVGINVNNDVSELRDIAVSLKEIKNEEINIDDLLNNILKNFEKISEMEFKDILKEYKENCSVLGKEIKIKTVDGEIMGKAVDVDEEGRIVVETKGERIVLREGDVSIG